MIADLKWLLDAGADAIVTNKPNNLFEPRDTTQSKELPYDPIISTSMQSKSLQTSKSWQTFGNNQVHPTPKSGSPRPIVPLGKIKENTTPILGAKASLDRARQHVKNIQSLRDLIDVIKKFKHCPSLSRTASNAAVYKGADLPEILAIGSHPTRQDDKTGTPFFGERFLLLARMFNAIGYDIHTKVGLTNTVFWYPPGARALTEMETAICKPFLDKIIALAHPKILLLFGGNVCSALLGKTFGIHKLRGQLHPYQYQGETSEETGEKTCIACYDPMYILETPKCKKYVWQDLKSIRQYLQRG